MAYKIVFFDIDGTLIDEEKQIPRDALEAVKELKKRNVEVVISTGRAPYFFTSIAEQFGIESFVSFNGSYVVYKGKVIYERTIPTNILESLEKEALANGHPLVFQGNEANYANHDQHPQVIESFRSLKIDPPAYRPHYWKEAKIFQALIHCQAHEEEKYLPHFKEVNFVRWHKYSMDVLPAHGSKAEGIQAVLKHLGISPAEAVAFGDGLNDKEMLSYVGMGIAMGNAHEQVKPFANFVTKHINEGGIKHGLEYAGLL
jgi:Cof subfamily protein (haloacid dehalogenase superfamily)